MSSNPFPSLQTNYTALLDVTQHRLGFDPTVLINVGLVLAAVSTALLYAGRSIYSYAANVILSSVHINEDDELYGSVMRFMSDKHTASQRFRSVKATTKAQSTWMEEESVAAEIGHDFDVAKLISYRALVSRAPILMTPFQSQHLFFHRGHLIYFKHSLHKTTLLYNPSQNERGYISLQCLGRSLVPLQSFLADTQLYSLQKNLATTTIYRALGDMRDRLRWQAVLSRPERDIRTVILDRGKKQALLADINEYLHPSTRRWYANHGIPYRRGYLFSGLPGTGKTSLTAALAGVFGLNIYVVSLLDPALTESQLNRLLSDVPNRCIVLLEDVDAAGLKRPGEISKAGNKLKPGTATGPADSRAATTAGEAVIADTPVQKPTTEISLSGLLNAIDGVSSHEGRILVMTTNSPESLDKALIRPGRVDMHIAFQLPGRDEMRQLFLSMYRDIIVSPTSQVDSLDAPRSNGRVSDRKVEDVSEDRNSKSEIDSTKSIELAEFEASDEMHEMAKTFAKALPEDRFSLAAIQGFLLRHKRDPRRACEAAATWAADSLASEE